MNPTMKRRGWIWAAAALLLAAAAAAVYFYNSRPAIPVIGEAAGFQLQDTGGGTVSLDSAQGKVRLVYFFYANCPDVCLPTNYKLSVLQEELRKKGLLGRDAVIMSITFDPKRDTTDKLKELSTHFQAVPKGWYFLRGEEGYTREVARKYGVSVIADEGGAFMHQNIFTLVDKQGKVRRWYNANDTALKIEDIANDMSLLSRE
ncbi:SCO family protein [Ferviditalea candida]|uniref:SCO family protein n=1 Tax=Ferviditalea candida TaxID=3108399 RepID=A0ABU5ZG96_9BACL|nr:SCO family protein [Paenibacillaceae bacterium T2]